MERANFRVQGRRASLRSQNVEIMILMKRDVVGVHVLRSSCIYGFVMFLWLAPILGGKGNAQSSLLIPGVADNHCSQIAGAPNSDVLACQVWDGRQEFFSAPLQIEIFRNGKRLQTIEPGAPIIEWHLWEDGKAIAVHFGPPGSYTLYSTATGSVLERSPGRSISSQLPEWAKSQAERNDEAVPQGPLDAEQRTQWIVKVLHQIQTIQAGMKRRELDLLFTTEGGISTRHQRTYVLRECQYIKINIQFRSVPGPADRFEGSPEDVIESVSKPYLEFGHVD